MSAAALNARVRRLFVILNPNSGTYAARAVSEALERHFPSTDGSCDIHQMSGHENLAELAREAVARGVDVVVAAGGDGTVSAVAEGLVGTETPLGILPLGTGNVLARELGIPVDLDQACDLLAGEYRAKPIDAMKAGDRHFYTHVGVGIDALMIRDTKREHKRRFGRLAYFWTGLVRLLGFQPRRFYLTIDGRPIRTHASQVLVANCGMLGAPPITWGPGIHPDDGRLDLCIIRAVSMWHYVRLSWNVLRKTHRDDPKIRYFRVEGSASIRTRTPLPVQADGEIIGETPVEVKIVRGAIRVVVPR